MKKYTIFGNDILSIFELLHVSWPLIRENFLKIIWISLIVYIPLNILISSISWPVGAYNIYTTLIFNNILIFLEICIGSIAVLAVVFVVDAKSHRKDITLQESFKKAFHQWPALIGTLFLQSIFMICIILIFIIPSSFLSLYLIIIPFTIMLVYWYFILFAVALRGKYWTSAMQYSFSLVSGNWWRIFTYLLVFTILTLIVSGSLFLIIGFISGIIGSEYDSISIILAWRIIPEVTLSFLIVLSTILFLNLESVKTSKVGDLR